MNVLVIAAHPDDEVLGCGGTIARHVANGDTVHILIAAEGATSRPGDDFSEELKNLTTAAHKAAEALGAGEPKLLALPDNKLDTLALLDIVQRIEQAVAIFEPDTIYTHHGGDLNRDHRIIHQAAITACRPLPGSLVRRIYTFEVLSSTEWGSADTGAPFNPVHFVDISNEIQRKKAAFECYAMEMREFPHPRSWEAVEAQMHLRGAAAGLLAAEAFQVVRQIETG